MMINYFLASLPIHEIWLRCEEERSDLVLALSMEGWRVSFISNSTYNPSSFTSFITTSTSYELTSNKTRTCLKGLL